MRPVFNEEVLELEQFLNFVLHPETYGCQLHKGDLATYQERAGYIVDAAAVIIKDLRGRPSVPPMEGDS